MQIKNKSTVVKNMNQYEMFNKPPYIFPLGILSIERQG